MIRSPFHIPELVEEIGAYLEQEDLARCARVCKSWHEGLIPLLYRNVRYDDHSRNMKSFWNTTQRYSRHIRSFTVSANFFPKVEELLGPECRYVTALALGPQDFVDQPLECHARLRSFVTHNPSIRTLQIDLRRHLSSSFFQEDNILRYIPALTNLAILDDRYPYSAGPKSNGAFEAILECGSQLESLTYQVFWGGSSDSLNNRGLNQEDDSKTIQTWPRLTSLTISGYEGYREIEFVKRCPNLKQLKAFFKKPNCFKVLHQMAQHYLSGHPSRLEHLEIMHLQGQQTKAALEELLRVCARPHAGLKTFRIHSSCMYETTFKTLLTYHANSLETLAAIGSKWANPFDLCLLFSMCPRLKSFEGVVDGCQLWFQDLVHFPWVCNDLRTLRLTICQNDSSFTKYQAVSPRNTADEHQRVVSTQRQFWRKLGMLKNLELLDILMITRDPSLKKMLSIVHEDLDHICGLKRLREIRILPGEDFMSNDVKEELQLRRPGLCIHYV
ncbi:hypothetical protein BGZ65_006869 [Modicella reniformis]|uniref:F-box domain-containing protein n=1 Tax=Modicella reniformis TaxID=1440133 RepID=A0A9P6LR89_9FUNG|nr:hypothetical protein BGZ65_006869 [Modicella reniformis]